MSVDVASRFRKRPRVSARALSVSWYEPSQLLEPVLDDDDLRRSGFMGGLLDHEKTLAVGGYVIGPAVTHTFGGVSTIDDFPRLVSAPRAIARVDPTRHEGATGRYIEQLLTIRSPEWPRAAGSGDQPLPRVHVGKRPDVDLESP